MRRLASLAVPFSRLRDHLGSLVLWQFVCLESGLFGDYPAHGGYPWMFRPVQSDWFRQAMDDPGVIRTAPGPDPVTGQAAMVFARRFPESGEPLGVTGVSVPVHALFDLGADLPFQEDIEPFLVRPEDTGREVEVRILAGEAERQESMMSMHWIVPEKTRTLVSGDGEAFGEFVRDLADGRSGVRFLEYEGRPSIWAYGAMSREGRSLAEGEAPVSLLFIVPAGEVTAEASAAAQAVRQRIEDQMRLTSWLLAGVALAVILAVILVSRSVAAGVSRLLEAFRQVRKGDFSVRAEVRGKDEFAALAESFNRMVPDLEDQLRMKKGLDLAGEVQSSLIPAKPPRIPGLDAAGRSRACDETGGDLFDALALPDGRLALVVGDVSGHGVAAALLMTSLRSLLRSELSHARSLKDAVAGANQLVVADTFGSGRFMTLFLLAAEPGGGRLSWVRAGHDPALVYDPGSDEFTELQGEGLPLGVLAEARFEEREMDSFGPGMIAVIGTDGIWETVHPETGEMFGKDRLKDIIRSRAGADATGIVDAVYEAVEAFRGSGQVEDDVTMAVIRAVPGEEEPSG